jgi:hypothetical protein
MRNISFALIIFLLIPNLAFSYGLQEQEHDQIMFGISFKNGKRTPYVSYKNEDNMSIKYNLKKKEKVNALNYSGYRNVEGYRNNKDKNEKIFAGTVIGIGVIAVLSVTAGLFAIANAVK